MRQVVLQMGMSVDGYSAHPPRGGEHPDLATWKLGSLSQVGTHVMGRVTYEEMATYWPNASGDYAEPMNDIPKVVFSTTLEKADWANSRIARGSVADEIAALKREHGGDIMVHGGASFAQSLSSQALIDEYRLVIRPVALGHGLPLFAHLAAPLRLTLVHSSSYPDGNAVHVYQPTSDPLESV